MESAHNKAFDKYMLLQRTIDPDKRIKLLKDIQNIANNVQQKQGDGVVTTGFIPYPSLDDPNFNNTLLQKLEFAQYRHTSNSTPASCDIDVFSLSNTQKFLKNLISPQTPYNSILIMHGTGVGKTCTAIGIVESHKNIHNKPSLVIGPPSLKGGFQKQIYDASNQSFAQCTGDEYGPDSNLAQYYEFVGYITFALQIEHLDKSLTKQAFERKLAELYSNRVIIIDEVQNLRKVQNKDKGVSNRIEQVLRFANNIKLVLLTATPLYNTVDELEFLMIMCYTNDKNWIAIDRIKRSAFLRNLEAISSSDHEILTNFARRYVSYMRGENPHTFPFRLYPKEAHKPSDLPRVDGNMDPIDKEKQLKFTPLMLSQMSKVQQHVIDLGHAISHTNNSDDISSDDDDEDIGWVDQKMTWLTEASNIVFPDMDNDTSGLIGSEGFRACMRSNQVHGSTVFNYNETTRRRFGEIFDRNNIKKYSPKIHTILQYAMRSEGVVIIYSRYIHSGLLPMALTLEHCGVNNYKGNLMSGGTREKNTGFRYAIIAGNVELSGNVDRIMNIARSPENMNGKLIKFILISVKAAEGYDFKFVRELHVLEPWYNLSRIEQVIGRGIRNCSHALLPNEKRNCTIFLHACSLPSKESNDIYMYRMSELKQVQILKAERVLKEYALDCHLNAKALNYPQTLFKPQSILNSQGQRLQIQPGDVDFTRVCDFMKCDFKCKLKPPNFQSIDESTFEISFIAKDIEAYIHVIVGIFSTNLSMKHKDLVDEVQQRITNLDNRILSHALFIMLNKKTRLLHGPSLISGYLIYRSDRYIFQPDNISDEKMTLGERAKIKDIANKRIVGRVNVDKQKKLIDAQSVLQHFEQRLKQMEKYDTGVDYVVDHLKEDELVIVSKHAIQNTKWGKVKDSLIKGHVIFTNDQQWTIYNYFNNSMCKEDGTPLSEFIARRLELNHLSKVRNLVSSKGKRRKGFIGVIAGNAVFKVVVPKQKDENVLSGAVCTAFSQLKKGELMQMINGEDLSRLSRTELCQQYELALRARKELLRPVENIAMKPTI